MKVLIAAPIHNILKEALESSAYELVYNLNITQQQALEQADQYVGIITSTRLMIDKPFLDQATQLKFIGRMGSGMEIIDQEYAAQKGVFCVSSPEGNCNAVAEHALAMILTLNNHLVKSYQELKKGLWLREENRGTELEGKTFAIIGYGHTGAALTRLLIPFGLNILLYDKYKTIDPNPAYQVCDSLAPIFERADFVSLHVPLQEDTYQMLNQDVINQFKKPIFLINTSRGPVLEPKMLIPSIQAGKIKALALDVWIEEPFSKMNPENKNIFDQLLSYDNVLLSPHIAGYSFEALYKMSNVLKHKLAQFLS